MIGKNNLVMNKAYYVLIQNTFIFAIGNVLSRCMSLFLMPLYTLHLTTEEFALGELSNNALEVLIPIFTLCIVDALYRFTIDDGVNIESIFTNATIVTFVGGVVAFGLSIILYIIYKWEIIFLIYLLFISNVFYKLITQFIRGLGFSRLYVILGIFNALFLLILSIVFLRFLNYGTIGYLSAYIISFVFVGCIGMFCIKAYSYFNLKSFDKILVRNMLSYSLPNVPNMLAWWLNSIFNRYIILYFCGIGVAGLYTAANKIPALINIFTNVFQQAWQYSTAKELNGEDGFFSEVFEYFSFVCVTFGILIILLNDFICNIILHSSFQQAVSIVPVLLLAAIFTSFTMFFGTFYNALKDNRFLMWSTIIGAILNVLLSICFIQKFDMFGGAVSMTISCFVVAVLRMYDVSKRIDIKIDWIKFFVKIFMLIVTVMVTFYEVDKLKIIVGVICILCMLILDNEIIKNILNQLLFYVKGKIK